MADKSPNTANMLKMLRLACLLGDKEPQELQFEKGSVGVDGVGNVFVSDMTLDEAITELEKPVCGRCGLKYRKRHEPEVCGDCKGKEDK